MIPKRVTSSANTQLDYPSSPNNVRSAQSKALSDEEKYVAFRSDLIYWGWSEDSKSSRLGSAHVCWILVLKDLDDVFCVETSYVVALRVDRCDNVPPPRIKAQAELQDELQDELQRCEFAGSHQT